MDNAINEYQKWKQQGESLRAQAKQAMEARFGSLLTEAAQIAQEYQVDFGAQLKLPGTITAFRFKRGAKAKPKKNVKPADPALAKPAKPDPRTSALQRSLAQTQKKIEAAKAAGKPTKNLEDKLYEIEDELRMPAGHR